MIGVATAPRPVLACSCAWPTLEQAFGGADVVFAGMPERGVSPFGSFWSGQRIQVDRVWKGEVPSSVFLVSGEYDPRDQTSTTSSCDAGAPLGERALVFATVDPSGYYYTWTCAGTQSWADGEDGVFVRTLLERHGSGARPDESLATHVPAHLTPSPEPAASGRAKEPSMASPPSPDASDWRAAEASGFARPAFALVLIAALFVLGGLAYTRLRAKR